MSSWDQTTKQWILFPSFLSFNSWKRKETFYWSKTFFSQFAFRKRTHDKYLLNKIRRFGTRCLVLWSHELVTIFNFFSGSDVDTRRRAACDLVKGLSRFFEPQITSIFGGYVKTMLDMYNANPTQAWKKKDAAIYLVTSLATKVRITNLFMSFGTIFWDVILGWYYNILWWKLCKQTSYWYKTVFFLS